MILWDDLLKSALLGTERQRPPLPAAGGGAAGGAAGGAMTETLSRLPAAEPDAALLGAAAVVSTCRRAGYVPPRDESAGAPPADADDLPQTSPRSAQHLRVILSEKRDLLPEWAAAAAEAGRRAPDVVLPQLLEVARTSRELRHVLQPVLGRRGRWLAAQRSEWSFAAAGGDPESGADAHDADALWQTGERAARLSLLTGLRRTNPTRARLLLETTWAQESADDRGRFLAAFAAGLSPADEPFLENALGDRGKEVRRTAVDLLARLPTSQLVRRMIDRATPLLAWKPGKKPAIEVTLPSAYPKDAERDGVEQKPTHARVGQKQWWLWQIVASVPPATWSKRWGAKPAEIVAAVRKNEFENVLVAAWAQAAARLGDAAWAEAIVSTEVATVLEWAGEQVLAQLLAALPPGRREALVLEQLAADTTMRGDQPASLVLLRAHGGAWSPRLTRSVLDWVREMIRKPPRTGYWAAAGMLRETALRVPPSMLDEMSKGWPEQDKAWERWKHAVDEFLATVQFRKDMLEEVRR